MKFIAKEIFKLAVIKPLWFRFIGFFSRFPKREGEIKEHITSDLDRFFNNSQIPIRTPFSLCQEELNHVQDYLDYLFGHLRLRNMKDNMHWVLSNAPDDNDFVRVALDLSRLKKGVKLLYPEPIEVDSEEIERMLNKALESDQLPEDTKKRIKIALSFDPDSQKDLL